MIVREAEGRSERGKLAQAGTTRELVSKPPNARLFIHLSFLKDKSNNIFL